MIKNWLDAILTEHNITAYQLAKNSQLHHSVIYNTIKRNSSIDNLTISTAEAIATGLGMTLIEFLEKYYEGGKE